MQTHDMRSAAISAIVITRFDMIRRAIRSSRRDDIARLLGSKLSLRAAGGAEATAAPGPRCTLCCERTAACVSRLGALAAVQSIIRALGADGASSPADRTLPGPDSRCQPLLLPIHFAPRPPTSLCLAL